MDLLVEFVRSVRGSAVEKFAFGAVLIVAASLASAGFLTKFAGNGSPIAVARVEPQPDPRYVNLGSLGPAVKDSSKFATIDQTPTGSLPMSAAQRVVLDPCTGKSK